jgi:hypothetical protein
MRYLTHIPLLLAILNNTFSQQITLQRVNGPTSDLYHSDKNQSNLIFYQQNFLFYTEAEIGTPPQKFRFILDTGSSDTWIPGSTCSDLNCGNHTKFYQNKSNSYQATNKTFQIQYGSGRVLGHWGKDTLNLSGIPVDNNYIGLVNQETSGLQSILVDGIIGLGLSSISSAPDNSTWLSNLHKQVPTMTTIFSFDLNLDNSLRSVFTIGNILDKYKQTPLNYHALVSPKGYWTLPLVGIKISDFFYTSQEYCHPYCPVIVDTGTSLVTIPEDYYLTIMLAVLRDTSSCSYNTDLGLFVCKDSLECRLLPPVTFQILDQQGKTRDYQMDPNEYLAMYSNGGCVILISKSPSGLPIWILGMSFLQRYYTIFNYAEMNLAMVDKKSHIPEDSMGKSTLIMAIMFVTTVLSLCVYYMYSYQQRRQRSVLLRQQQGVNAYSPYNNL